MVGEMAASPTPAQHFMSHKGNYTYKMDLIPVLATIRGFRDELL